MEYNFNAIETKWRQYWTDNKVYKTVEDTTKPKFYVLDMFPYPSGAGLHVGHPLGYIASDIYARYKRLMGFNVLHPMGFDAYGLPAEQYAIQTGQHPAITTARNIQRYREQLDKIGFSFDWERAVETCDPAYYKWTQWTFIQLFKSYYCYDVQQARPIDELIEVFSQQGIANLNIACTEHLDFTAEQWNAKSEKQQQETLMNYRLAYLSDTVVNWCPKLGTVLANDEVSNGLSVRGGFPVERKAMRQWSLRISAYADRLLTSLDTLEWSDSIKEVQRNWIGKSKGCQMQFKIADSESNVDIFTTRADTIFGATFMVFSPEHVLISSITTPEQRQAVEDYVAYAKNRSERERQAEVGNVSGVFTGAYAINPFTETKIPIWISDYVLSGYGTGAIMAVPAHDDRDYRFAKYFKLPIIQVVAGGDITTEAFETKEGTMINSQYLDGKTVNQAIDVIIQKAEQRGIGKAKINYRLRDAIFSRQRYWGEPFPMYYKDGMPYTLDEQELPLLLPPVDKYLPTETGEPPLARATQWITKEGYPLETATMPGFAGSSAYYLRYMDVHNDTALVSKEAVTYWKNVDLYVGGSEHATGHLIYSRFWNKFLFDIGVSCTEEPFQKMINQGMILGRSSLVYRVVGTNKFVSLGLKDQYEVQALHVDISMVDNDNLNIEQFKQWQPDYANAEFILENGKYVCGVEIEKMSKSFYNVQNPDDLVERYGADTLRMYEMFLGPIEQSKPWDTQGIEGVSRFLKKTWRLFFPNDADLSVVDVAPTPDELRVLHKTIRKIQEDSERFAFNTAVSTFMIAVNELTDLKCHNRSVLESLLILLSPYTPHIAEELWSQLGRQQSIQAASYPIYEPQYVVETTVTYPVSFNGKTRFTITLPNDLTSAEVESAVLATPDAQKWLNGQTPKKVIVVPKKIVNIVV